MKIEKIKARKIFNSRGEETIEVIVNSGLGSSPAGLSRGKYEVNYFPRGSVDLAVERFNEFLVPQLKGREFFGFEDLEWVEDLFFELGGYDFFGGNTLLALEYALIDALSKYLKVPKFKILNENVSEVISRPLSNVIGGGKHSRNLGPDFQEFLVLNNSETFYKSVKINSEFHRKLGLWLKEKDKNFLGAKNDEGAWVPSLSNTEILDLLLEFKYIFEGEYGVEVKLGLDVAASSMYRDGKYVYRREKLELNPDEQIEFIIDIIKRYDLFYVEDPLYEDDFAGFSKIKEKVSSLIVGDDLTATNPDRVMKAIKNRSVSGVIVKPNQVGSLIMTREVIEICKSNSITPILSHRSGETNDNTLSHLAVAWEVPIVKFGIVNGERISKLNEIIRIEDYLRNR